MTDLFDKIHIQKYIYVVVWLLCFSIPLRYQNGRIGFFSAIIFLLWILEGNFKYKFHTLKKNKLFILFLIFLGYNVLSLLWTDYLEVGIKTLDPYKYYLLYIPPIITSIPPKKVPSLIFAFILGLLIHSTLAYIVLFLDLKVPFTSKVYTPYAIYSPFTAFCVLYFLNKLFQKDKSINERINFLVISITLVILLFLKDGRTGQISFIFSLLVLILLYNRRPIKTIVISAFAIIFIFILIFNIDIAKQRYVAIKNQMLDVFQTENFTKSLGARVGLILANIEAAKQSLLFGSGIGDSRDALQRLYERGKKQSFYALAHLDHSHNQYLTFLTKLGLLGLSLFIAYIVMFFNLNILNVEMKNLSILFIAMFSLNCLGNAIMFMKPYNTYFAILSALFMNISSSEKAPQSTN